jgi:hypothetical protein
MSEHPLQPNVETNFVNNTNEYPVDTGSNRYGIYRISHGIISLKKGQELSSERVAREMGLQGIEDVSKVAVTDYTKQLTNMKTDICSLTKVWYQSLCIRKAIALGITKSDTKTANSSIPVSSWSEISQSYIESPSWKKIEQLYHVLYTSLDLSPNFHDSLEQHWMTTNNVEYSDEKPSGEGSKTGIHSLIVMKVNMMRKDFNKKISNKHRFAITKSLPKVGGKQAKRRVISHFKKEFVTINRKNAALLPSSVKTFDDYLQHINGKNYKEYVNENDLILEEIDDDETILVPSLNEQTNKQNQNKPDQIFWTENSLPDIEFEVCNPSVICSNKMGEKSQNNIIDEHRKKKLIIRKEQRKLEELNRELSSKVASYKEMIEKTDITNKYNDYVKEKKSHNEKTKKKTTENKKKKVSIKRSTKIENK